MTPSKFSSLFVCAHGVCDRWGRQPENPLHDIAYVYVGNIGNSGNMGFYVVKIFHSQGTTTDSNGTGTRDFRIAICTKV